MKRSLLIPSAVSLAAHALLLFGFTSPEKTALPKPAESEPWYDPIDLVAPKDELDLPDESGGDEVSAETPVPVPMSPEPVALPRPEGPEMPLPPRMPVPVDGLARDRIPTNWGRPGEDLGRVGRPVLPAHLLDNVPTTRYRVAPSYPFAARREGRNGEVVVEFVVNERGEVLSPRVVRSSGVEFEEPTLRAIAKWRFEPGRKDGRPVRFRMTVPVIFNVNE